MQLTTIAHITQRETRETLSDWRIILPISLLTFLVPLLLAVAAQEVVEFVDDAGLASRLVPFAALLVGFLPTSFSLIISLESFVGERERNTLESLMAMPISDHELYVAKVFSSLATPIISSFMAILIFSGLTGLISPELAAGLTPDRIGQLMLMVAAMSITMVSGAVVISSHISTIKAANLMSSFILLPMIVVVQVASVQIINERWSQLWLLILGMAFFGIGLVRVGMGLFSREEILSREHRQGDLTVLIANLQARWGKISPSRPSSLRGGPVLAIMQRELRETSTDIRVIIPIVLLSCIVPLLLVSGVDFAVEFVGDASQVARLVPFASLLIGFIPATFALITALESFVGERERNTLESLLAMPLADNGLYFGKLFAVIIVPLLGSLAAVTVFLVALLQFYPAMYNYSMNGSRAVLVLLCIGMITVMLVAGAVVISSHTSSIRAATLLASGLLIPTSILIQLSALLFIASRWDVMVFMPMGLSVLAIGMMRTGIATFNREEILSREVDQISIGWFKQTFKTFFHEYQPAGVFPDHYQGQRFSPRRFYQHEMWALLRDLRLPLLIATGGAVIGVVIGSEVAGWNELRIPIDSAIERLGFAPPSSPLLSILVFFNNLRVSILSNLFSSISFGLFAFLVPLVAFAQISGIATALQIRGGEWLEMGRLSPLTFLLAYVMPHGIVELPTFLLSTALGLRIGVSVFAPPPGFSVAQNMIWALANFCKMWLLLIAPLVLLAALIEGMITPWIVRALY